MRQIRFVAISLLPVAVGYAQTATQTCDGRLGISGDAILAATKTISGTATPQQRVNIRNGLNLNLIAACLASPTIAAATIKNIEAKRTDVQVGAPAAAAGTTTAVSFASKPNFIGLALENGAETRTTSGTSTTISINPYKFIKSLADDEKVNLDPAAGPSAFVRRLAITGTLNTGSSSGSKTTTTGTGANAALSRITTQAKEVSDLTVHFDIINDRDPMSGGAAAKIRNASTSSVLNKDFFDAADRLTLNVDSEMEAETTNLLAMSFSTSADVQTELKRWLNELAIGRSDAVKQAAALVDRTLKDAIASNLKLYDQLAHSPTLSLEYSLDRQPTVAATAASSATTPAMTNTPDLHTGRLIHANRLVGSAEYTINASASFFSQKPAGAANNWRDYELGAKIDIPFSGITNVVDKGTLTFSGLFVDLKEAPLGINLTVNGVSVTQPGRIGLFQAKYTIPLGNGTGAQVPIAITYSNRTDLIKDTTVQGSIGLTFDWSKLVAAKQLTTAQSGQTSK